MLQLAAIAIAIVLPVQTWTETLQSVPTSPGTGEAAGFRSSESPTMHVDPDGDVHLFWNDFAADRFVIRHQEQTTGTTPVASSAIHVVSTATVSDAGGQFVDIDVAFLESEPTHLYCTWREIGPGREAIWFGVSTNSGATWTNQRVHLGSPFKLEYVQSPQIALNDIGEVVIAWAEDFTLWDMTPSSESILVSARIAAVVSTDSGANWSSSPIYERSTWVHKASYYDVDIHFALGHAFVVSYVGPNSTTGTGKFPHFAIFQANQSSPWSVVARQVQSSLAGTGDGASHLHVTHLGGRSFAFAWADLDFHAIRVLYAPNIGANPSSLWTSGVEIVPPTTVPESNVANPVMDRDGDLLHLSYFLQAPPSPTADLIYQSLDWTTTGVITPSSPITIEEDVLEAGRWAPELSIGAEDDVVAIAWRQLGNVPAPNTGGVAQFAFTLPTARFAYSSDAGVTWSSPVDLNDDLPGNSRKGGVDNVSVVLFDDAQRSLVIWDDRRYAKALKSDALDPADTSHLSSSYADLLGAPEVFMAEIDL